MSADCPKCLNGCGGVRSDCPKNAQPPIKRYKKGQQKPTPKLPPPPKEPKRAPALKATDITPETRWAGDDPRLGILRRSQVPIGKLYEPKFDKIAASMARMGATELEIADGLGVSIGTLRSWMITRPSFNQALNAGRHHADERVEHALYSSAIGYSYDTSKILIVDGQPVEVEVRQHMPPSPAACFFWLKNRKPQQWRHKPPEDEGDKPTTIVIEGGLPPEEE